MLSSSASLLATIPSPDQGEWQVGTVEIRAYVLCVVVGVVVPVVWGSRRWCARGGRKGTVLDVAAFALPLSLIGGRLQHVAADRYEYFSPDRDPWDALKIWEGGLGTAGAIAFGAAGVWIACRLRGISWPALADALAPGVVLAPALAGLGNWFNEEIEGAATSLPWGLEIYRRIDPDTGLADPMAGVAADHTPLAVVHPVFFYGLLWNIAVAALVVCAEQKFRMDHGRVFALAVAGYTAGRVWIDMLRADAAAHIFGVRVSVVASLIVCVLAVAYLAFVHWRTERPAQVPQRLGTSPSQVENTAERESVLSTSQAGPGKAATARRDLPARDDVLS